MGDVKAYYCDGCGGIMEFDATSQNLKCPNCGIEVEIEDEEKQIIEHKLTEKAKQEFRVEEVKSTKMECEGCGAIIEVDALSTSTECPYCGSNYVLSEKQVDIIVPDGVLPFRVAKQDVNEIFCKWIDGRKFAPNELKGLYQRDKIQGIYIPYWTFDAKATADYTAMGGIERHVTRRNEKGEEETVVVVDWHFISGMVDNFFDDVLVKASDKLPKNLSDGLFFNTKNISSYSPEYISGYCSEIYNIDLKTAQSQAQNEMKYEIEGMCRNKILRSYQRVKDLRVNLNLYDQTYKYVLLPVYSTSYMYKGKQYNVLINGQTGNLQGEYPKSPAKVAAVIALIIFIVAIMFYFMNS